MLARFKNAAAATIRASTEKSQINPYRPTKQLNTKQFNSMVVAQLQGLYVIIKQKVEALASTTYCGRNSYN